MSDNTINDVTTFVGGDKGVVLVGRYHITCQLGQGGMGRVSSRTADCLKMV